MSWENSFRHFSLCEKSEFSFPFCKFSIKKPLQNQILLFNVIKCIRFHWNSSFFHDYSSSFLIFLIFHWFPLTQWWKFSLRKKGYSQNSKMSQDEIFAWTGMEKFPSLFFVYESCYATELFSFSIHPFNDLYTVNPEHELSKYTWCSFTNTFLQKNISSLWSWHHHHRNERYFFYLLWVKIIKRFYFNKN